MEKIMRVFLVTLGVLAVTGVANAATTSLLTPSPQLATAPFGINYTSPTPSSVSWAFDWTAPAGNLGVDHADLVINASDVTASDNPAWADDIHRVYVGSIAPANLLSPSSISFGQDAHDTSFVVPVASVNPAGTTFVIDLWATASHLNTDDTMLNSATLNVWYIMPDPDPDPQPQPTVPAPAAVVLGSLGVGLVGWLRRRHMV